MSASVAMLLAYTVALPAGIALYVLLFRPWDAWDVRHSIVPLLWSFVAALGFEVLATLSRLYFHHNLVVLSIGVVVDGILLMWFIGKFQYVAGLKLLPTGTLILLVVATAEATMKGAAFWNVTYTVKNLLVLVPLFLFIRDTMKGIDTNRQVFFLFAVIMFYHVANFVFFLYLSTGIQPDLLMFMVIVHSVINAVCNLTFAIILWNRSLSKSWLFPS